MEERTVWVVETNDDLTEGRGRQFVKAVCELEATAIRIAKRGYVQGNDCPIRKDKMFRHEGKWYVPASITGPTETDRIEEEKIKAARDLALQREEIAKKAEALGLTQEEIKILKG